MSRQDRVSLIEKLEEKLHSPVICYVITDRENIPPYMIGDDDIRIMHNHFEAVGMKDQINLFLYTRGGAVMPAFRIVRIMRDYCKIFKVLVPYRAHSAGTQIALGADEIIMGKMGELSPVDPSTGNEFNPQDPLNPQQRVSISVEDVKAFFDLAKEAGLVSENHKFEVFRILANRVHPIALGNIQRVSNEIPPLVKKLLDLHMDAIKDKDQINYIVKALTEERTHEYLITYEEAKEIGLKVIRPDEELENLMWRLYGQYEKDLQLLEPFDPVSVLGSQSSVDFRFDAAIIECSSKGHLFIQEGTIYASRPSPIPIPQVAPELPIPAPVPVSVIGVPPPPVVRLKPGKWIEI
jgi:hypothetical protein